MRLSVGGWDGPGGHTSKFAAATDKQESPKSSDSARSLVEDMEAVRSVMQELNRGQSRRTILARILGECT